MKTLARIALTATLAACALPARAQTEDEIVAAWRTCRAELDKLAKSGVQINPSMTWPKGYEGCPEIIVAYDKTTAKMQEREAAAQEAKRQADIKALAEKLKSKR